MSQTLTKPILLDETGVAIKTALNNIGETESQDWLLSYEDVHSEMDDNVDRIADALEAIKDVMVNSEWFLAYVNINAEPSSYNKQVGDIFEDTDIGVYGVYYNTIDPTHTVNVDTKMIKISSNDYTVSLPYGSMLGDTNSIITVTYTDPKSGRVFTSDVDLNISVPMLNGYLDETSLNSYKKALNAHYAGVVDLHNYWSIGDNVRGWYDPNDGNDARHLKITIMNKGGKELVTPINGQTECAFVIGMEYSLYVKKPYGDGTYYAYSQYDLINIYDDYDDLNDNLGWENTKTRTWMNETFPTYAEFTGDTEHKAFTDFFKPFKNTSSKSFVDPDTIVVTEDLLTLPSEKEVFGTVTKGSSVVDADSTQLEYFQNSVGRIDTLGYINDTLVTESPEPVEWATRTLYKRTGGTMDERDRYRIVTVNRSGNVDESVPASRVGFVMRVIGVI